MNKEPEQITIHSPIVSIRIDFLKKELWSLSSTHTSTRDTFPNAPQLGQIAKITNHLREEFGTIDTITHTSGNNKFSTIKDKNRKSYTRFRSNIN